MAAHGLFAALFPSDCRLCGAPLLNISRLPVCESCLLALRPIDAEAMLCSLCGERLLSVHFDADSGENLCGLCRRVQPSFEKAAAYGSYDGGLRDLIHLLKYDHVRPAAAVLGRMLAEVVQGLAPHFTAAEVLLVPVPLHSARLRQRGFNQAELIARAALRELRHHALGARLRPTSGALVRRRPTETQTGLTRHQRRENIRGAFALGNAADVAGREVLLVDHVFTTGTTVGECARVLRRAGAQKVLVATVARVLKAEAMFASPEAPQASESVGKAAGA